MTVSTTMLPGKAWTPASAETTATDFASLPAMVQQKFFSNVERLHIRLAQGDHAHAFDYRPNVANAPRFGLHLPFFRSQRHSSLVANSSSPRKQRLHTPLYPAFLGSQPAACLATHADLDWFLALPPKVQLSYFSGHERHQLIAIHRHPEILDSADRALYRRQTTSRSRPGSESSSPNGTAVSVCLSTRPSTPDLDDSDDNSGDDMGDSLYDSFRWLDEDGELDLTLDAYQPHVSSSTSNLPSRRRPSFRRTLSLNSVGLARKLPSSVSQRAPSSSQSSTIPSPLTTVACRNSISRPPSRPRETYHTSRSSTSSVDPSAQYYQDPDARLKLRVYLASPQKFDEAVEFGFPALKSKENCMSKPAARDLKVTRHDFTGTFLEDDDVSSISEEESSQHVPRKSSTMNESRGPQELGHRNNNRQSRVARTKPVLYQQPGTREMTLKMTLTRPDLRADSGPPSPAADLLRLEDLPGDGTGMEPWEIDKGEQSLVKKMWRKIRGQAI